MTLTYTMFAIVGMFACAIIAGKWMKGVRKSMPLSRVEAKTDADWINEGKCPDCHAEGTLCAGPSGGMSQNVACEACHMEFNVHMGFGTGAFSVDRTGKLSPGRARSAFGIDVSHPE